MLELPVHSTSGPALDVAGRLSQDRVGVPKLIVGALDQAGGRRLINDPQVWTSSYRDDMHVATLEDKRVG